MVTIPEGTFLMGANPNKEPNAEWEETPQREIFLSTYKIQQTPVTVGLWKQFLQDTNYNWIEYEQAKIINQILQQFTSQPSLSLIEKVLQVSPTDNHPIVFVSWFDAHQFTVWLTNITEENYSLPTEAQWEKACRGTQGQLYPWGNDEKYEWYDEVNLYSETTQQVGLMPERQSPYGCLDMWHNVSEWCLDWYDEGDYYNDSTAPKTNPSGAKEGESRIYRGGNSLKSGWPRCSYRGFQSPYCRASSIGFRVVLNL